jgi:predicted phosphodiesterase
MPTAKPPTSLRWFTTVLILLLAVVPAYPAEFVHGPYSGAPSAASVVISWSTDDVVPARVEFERWSNYEESQLFSQVANVDPFEPDLLHQTTHVTLQGLDPSADYVYRVVLIQTDSEVVSPIGAFSTAPNPGEPVDFAVIADTQQQLEGINRLALVASGIATDPTHFDFILHGGDVVEIPSTHYWDDWFSSFAEMLLRAPFIPVLGNHEKNHRSYYEAFTLPPGAGKENKRWWALHWGDVVVVGLDSNVDKSSEFREQQDWARKHLSGPEPHKFVVFHHPVFTSGEEGSGYFLDEIYHPIFVETGVDIVFNGHSHHYEHIVRDGVTYLVVGGGGATPRQTQPEHIQGSDVSVEGCFFYTKVHTGADGIQVVTIAVGQQLPDGSCAVVDQTIDAFSLPPLRSEASPPEGVTFSPSSLLAGCILLAVLVAMLLVAVFREGPRS